MSRLFDSMRIPTFAAACLIAHSTLAASLVCGPEIDAKKFNVKSNVKYLDYDKTPQLFDLYKPYGVSNAPLIVLVHGGAWAQGSKNNEKFVYISEELATLGFSVANFDYPLWKIRDGSTRDGFPMGISALRCGVRFLMAHAVPIGFDTARVSFMGTSAGANLAGLLAYAGAQNSELNRVTCPFETTPLPRAKSVILYYPPVDLADTYVPTDVPSAQDPSGRRSVAFEAVPWVRNYLNNDPAKYSRQASLLPYLNTRAVGDHFDDRLETLIVHGDRDQNVDIRQSRLLNNRLAELHMFKTFIVEKGYPHGFNPFRVPSSCNLLEFLNRFAR